MFSNEECVKYLNMGADKARQTSENGIGGPFGAAIVSPDGLVCVASNTVLESHDPTAHAEVNAIREASKRLGTHDLSKCTLFATSEPCPMCRAAIIWANIRTCVYSNTAEDADDIGFRDDFMYDYFRNGCDDMGTLSTYEVPSKSCKDLLKEYKENNRQMY